MLGPSPENVALLGHAGTTAGVPCNGVRALAARQTGRFGGIELLLNLGVRTSLALAEWLCRTADRIDPA